MPSQSTLSDRIIIFDTTLRDGEQAPGASMTIPEKLQIALQLERLGVDVIEAGFPVSSPAQRDAVTQIGEALTEPVICGLARATRADLEAAGEALRSAKKSRIHTFIATSDIHLKSKFGDKRYGVTIAEKRQRIMEMAVEAITIAKGYTQDIEFSAEDAGRTDTGYLVEIVQAAIEAGATTINIPDTTGFCVPHEYQALFETLRAGCAGADKVTFSVHCHDDLGLAVANSLAGVAGGARQIECTLNGIGERAGNAALEEVAMAINVRKDHFDLHTGIRPKLLFETSRLVSECSNFVVQPNKSIVGKNAFSHEAGIHQDGVLKSRETYEIMRAEDVGQTSEAIRLGRHSGRHGLFSRLERLGHTIVAEHRDDIYRRFVELADKKKEIYDEDLHVLMDQVQRAGAEKGEQYELRDFHVSVSTHARPTATVDILHVRTGQVATADGTGDGPVDALYRAVNKATREIHELQSYTIRSISEGADAIGEVTTEVGDGLISASGKSAGPDILRASVEAYIDALNGLAAHRAETEAVKFASSGVMQAFGGESQRDA